MACGDATRHKQTVKSWERGRGREKKLCGSVWGSRDGQLGSRLSPSAVELRFPQVRGEGRGNGRVVQDSVSDVWRRNDLLRNVS